MGVAGGYKKGIQGGLLKESMLEPKPEGRNMKSRTRGCGGRGQAKLVAGEEQCAWRGESLGSRGRMRPRTDLWVWEIYYS